MPAESADAPTDEYLVRTYEPSDRSGFLALYETVYDKRRSAEWVTWRYGGPYIDGVRMVVAEREGEVVGAEPFISQAIRAGDRTVPTPARRRDGSPGTPPQRPSDADDGARH